MLEIVLSLPLRIFPHHMHFREEPEDEDEDVGGPDDAHEKLPDDLDADGAAIVVS